MTSSLLVGFIICGVLVLLFLLSPFILLSNILYLRKIFRLIRAKKPLLRKHYIIADFPHQKEARYKIDPIESRCYSLGFVNAFRLTIKSGIKVEIGIITKVKSIFSSNKIEEISLNKGKLEEKFIIECLDENFLKIYFDLEKIECLDMLASNGLISIYCKYNLLVAFFDNAALELSDPQFERVIIEPLKILADWENCPNQRPFSELTFFELIKSFYSKK
jgi:hypothetical protein